MKSKYIIDKNKLLEFATFFVENKSTIRKTAKYFNVSKSFMHICFHKKLININYSLYLKVLTLLNINNKEKHIRGGIATKNKFKQIKTK